MKTKIFIIAVVSSFYIFHSSFTARAGTVITANLPANTAIVNIDATVDGAASYNGDQSLWYSPYNGSGSLLTYAVSAGTYTFRVIDAADAAQMFPALTSAQTNQIYTAWTFNTPWLEDYLVFGGAAANDNSIPQLFDGAYTNVNDSGPWYSDADTAYNSTIANGSYNKIRLESPSGRDGTTFVTSYTFTTATNLIFVVPDNGLYDNAGGVSVLVSPASSTTIDAANNYAYGANIGWADWRGDTNNGAVIGEYVCSGYIYSANVGWISLGNGSPADGIYYQNNSANDFGVNQDGLGNLRGYAYGANIGWINFEDTGAPKVDLQTGNLSGYVWSANCGWISLSNAVAYLQTDTIQQGALAPDGLPIAWLLQNFGTTNVDANADPDHDGMNNFQEYVAGTDPNNGGDFLQITNISRASVSTLLQWTAKPSRFYSVENRTTLTSGSWNSLYSTPSGASTFSFSDTNTNDFFRVAAYRPLMP